jgi:hypothetical protein
MGAQEKTRFNLCTGKAVLLAGEIMGYNERRDKILLFWFSQSQQS